MEVEMFKKCTPLWRIAHIKVKMMKAPHVRTTFGTLDVQKVPAVLVRSTFRSQNVQDTPCTFGPLLAAAMSKKFMLLRRSRFRSQNVRNTPRSDNLWRKSVKILRVSGHFWELRCGKNARPGGAKHIITKMKSPLRSQHVENTPHPDYFWTVSCREERWTDGWMDG